MALCALPISPESLPWFANAVCFDIELGADPLSHSVRTDGLLALHVAGDVPELQLSLWLVDAER